MTLSVTQPGIYDIPAAVYHADPVPGGSLSHSGAVRLLPPSCPAKYRYWVDNHDPPNENYDIGTAAHNLILRGVKSVTIIEYDDWRTKEARTLKQEAYAEGKVPILWRKWQEVQDMAEALWRHPVASALLRGGQPEQAIFWETNGIWRRMLTDFLPDRDPAAMYGVDYKTCECAHEDAVRKAMWGYRYVQQSAWYQTGMRAVGKGPTRGFYFIFQEKAPPYIVTIAQPDPAATEWGHNLNTDALAVYQTCRATGRWPGYHDEPILVGLPRYAEHQLNNRYTELR